MIHISLNRAYAALLGLSILTTLLAELRPQAGTIFVAMVLLLAGLKSRIILRDYLGLRSAPEFSRGFTAFLVLFLLTAFGLYLAG